MILRTKVGAKSVQSRWRCDFRAEEERKKSEGRAEEYHRYLYFLGIYLVVSKIWSTFASYLEIET